MQSRRCVPAMIGSELEHSGALGGVCTAPPWTAVPRGRSVRDWAARGCSLCRAKPNAGGGRCRVCCFEAAEVALMRCYAWREV